MTKPINWNEVKVGETEIKWCGAVYRVMGLRDSWAWLLRDGNHFVYSLAVIEDGIIYDPWEEITNNCQWVRCTHTNTLWVLYHENQAISHVNPRYRVDAPRVWKRKEG